MRWEQVNPPPEECRCCTEPECGVCEYFMKGWFPIREFDNDNESDILWKIICAEKGGDAVELTGAVIRRWLPSRDPWGHKGIFGKVYCLCGSVGYTGAPVFAGRAAVRGGSGLVYVGVPESVWSVVAAKSDEAMVFPLPDAAGKLSAAAEETIRAQVAGCDAVLIGCGLGRGEESDAMVRRLLDLPQPLVLDADGINALAGHIDALERRRGAVTVLTPHEGEFSRIGTLSLSREAAASDFARQNGVYVVLKGHRTVIAAPDGQLAVNPTGNSGMAKGGSGDVLAGLVLSLLGQGAKPFEACCAAVYLHGLAGDLAARDKTERGMTPTDLVEYLPAAYKEIER
ncbi:MAG: NAD(P)H-hydrate dehydratase [Oscillospiraceae bacterium]|nr:NAD(P)H-hydrate dehydratase [Oscillospiraceae bacterium]